MDRIHLERVGKRYCKLQGVRLLFHWKSWRNPSDRYWFWALSDINLQVKGESWLGVIGPNGSGKTTLLRVLAGVTEPTCGSVTVHGRVVSILELFSAMQPNLTGRENIYFYGALLGMRRRDISKKLDSIVSFAGIGNFLDMAVRHYSSGMMMRLGFSVATHVEAEIILVDEAWSIGDAVFFNQSLSRLHSLARQGATIILVSHELELIRQCTQQAIWLQQGKIFSAGPTSDVIAAYQKSL
jgi:ABC-type polysaccharide/polyol phosphate transport system ATPase subunit